MSATKDQSHDTCEHPNSDTDSVHSDGTESSVPNSDATQASTNPPGTPPNEVQQLSDVAIRSPGNSFRENDRITGPHTRILAGEMPLDDMVDSATTFDGLPQQFLGAVQAGSAHDESDRKLSIHLLGYLLELKREWTHACRRGFVTQDIHGADENQYHILQKFVVNAWNNETASSDVASKSWIAFVRCIRVDFWSAEHKIVLIAPTLEEDLTNDIASYMALVLRQSEPEPFRSTIAAVEDSIVKTDTLQTVLKCSAVHIDAAVDNEDCDENEVSGTGLPSVLGPLVFFCSVAQTAEEFVYQTGKIAELVNSQPLLQGFLHALIGPPQTTSSATTDYECGPGERIECRVLLYNRDDFPQFLHRANKAKTLTDWNHNEHHMWLKTTRGRFPVTVPADGWRNFVQKLETIRMSYAAVATEARRAIPHLGLDAFLAGMDTEEGAPFSERVAKDIGMRLAIAVTRVVPRVRSMSPEEKARARYWRSALPMYMERGFIRHDLFVDN
ncbi:uncharacterized protein B0H18DRAFT_959976 [Fomitopsis serialis]|uniref:uncharacterized protein n=1 Tax=Fomitopsis serialis TaxID=139415 RepID=UPI00200829BC|nr:uncharacterized protein B0H18DRAFT_959976 [Neoantrodia serialis]KAH9914241.1 hypothetical protein B0H18DRAFT_959976 [Neoantrodia serialis]